MKNKKYTYIILYITFIFIILSGCKKGSEKEISTTAVYNSYEQSTVEVNKSSETVEASSDAATEEITETEETTVVAVEETDSQQEEVTKSELFEDNNGDEEVENEEIMDDNSFAAGYEGAKQYSQLVIIRSHGVTAEVSMHELQDGIWHEILTTDGFVGNMGVGQASEFTSVTPAGTYPLYFAFGIKPNPGTSVPYLQVDENDYWVGDSSSNLYNQYKRIDSYDTDWSKEDSERIIDYPGSYDYCLFIGYNVEGVPGKGSCYFLHCSIGIPTAGCVAVPESDMVFILNHIGGNCGIVIE